MAIDTRQKRQSIHTLRKRRPIMVPGTLQTISGRQQLAGVYAGVKSVSPPEAYTIMTPMRVWGPI